MFNHDVLIRRFKNDQDQTTEKFMGCLEALSKLDAQGVPIPPDEQIIRFHGLVFVPVAKENLPKVRQALGRLHSYQTEVLDPDQKLLRVWLCPNAYPNIHLYFDRTLEDSGSCQIVVEETIEKNAHLVCKTTPVSCPF